MGKELNKEQLLNVRKEYLNDNTQKVLRHALSKTTFNDVFMSKDNAHNTDFTFSIEVETLPATNQMRSGRCWIFSASNVLREIIAKKCNIKGQFEISQNFIAYYDKLEKFNYHAQGIIELIMGGAKHDDRKLAFLLDGVGDGGQWQMFVELIKKYGLCPKAAFIENAQSSETFGSTRLCNSALRKFAADAYHSYEKNHDEAELYALKDEFNKKIFNILTSSFGVPPEKFDFEYVDKDNNYHIEKDLTPLSFFNKYIGKEIDEFISLIHAPTKDKEYLKTYSLEYVGNVVGGKPIVHLNEEFDRLEELIIQTLKDGEIVWFGSDVGKFGDREKGIWDDNAYDYVSAFGADLQFDKADMLDFNQAAMNHAMCITGVDIKEGKPIRWKIENSWGEASGNKGFYLMSESFFRQFVFQVAIRRKYLNDAEFKALEQEPILLPPWDPFGTLAE
ncbi:MAG: C1 family peptidase [Bacilli bacterium]|nr:C1 family peptidase [Bacilli bacterium]